MALNFFFYSNEHELKHIHIMKGEEFAKVNLENLKVEFNNLKAKIYLLSLIPLKNLKMNLKGNRMDTLIKAKNVRFDEEYLIVYLEDERIIQTPLKWYKELENASLKELKNWRFICNQTGIEWENLDCHLSVESTLKNKAYQVA